jgi:hypothetical protein
MIYFIDYLHNSPFELVVVDVLEERTNTGSLSLHFYIKSRAISRENQLISTFGQYFLDERV